MTARDQTFLYCHLIYGRDEAVFSVLPDQRAEVMKKQAKKYVRFPREVRLTLVLKLFGYLVRHVRNPYLEMVHPSWIAEMLREENPVIAGIVLMQFSPDYQKRLKGLLPDLATQPAPDRSESSELVFQVLTNHFASMAAPWGDPELSLDSLYLLREEDLMMVIRQIGLHEMGRAFAAAGRDALGALSKRFSGEMRNEFLHAAEAVSSEPADAHRAAASRLRQIDLSTTRIDEAVLKSGLAVLASALHDKASLKRRVAYRLPRNLGLWLLEQKNDIEEPVSEEFILEFLQNLISQGKVDKSFIYNRFASSGDLRKSSKMKGVRKLRGE